MQKEYKSNYINYLARYNMKLFVLLSLFLMNFLVFSSKIQSQVLKQNQEYCVNHSSVFNLNVQGIPQFSNESLDFPEINIPSKIKKEKIQSNSFFVDSIKGYFFNDSISTQIFKYNEKGQIVENLILMDYNGVRESRNRSKYEFDADGKASYELKERYAFGEWYAYFEKTNIYENGNLIEIRINRPDSSLPAEERMIYTYNISNQIINYSYYSRNPVEQLKLRFTGTITYDSIGNKAVSLREDMIDSTKIRFTYIYDSNKNVLTELEDRYKKGIWTNKSIYLYTYNSFNKQISSESKSWGTTDWINQDKHFYTYNSNNDITEDLYLNWKNEKWVNQSYKKYYYEDSILNKEEYFIWFGTDWLLNFVKEYKLNSNQKRISEEIYFLSNDSLHLQKITSYGYDNNNNLNLITFQESINNIMKPCLSYEAFDDEFNNIFYCSGFKSEIYWKNPTLNINTQSHNNVDLICFPNPSNERTKIYISLENESFVSLQITNILGQVVGNLITNKFMESGEHSFDFDASNLPAGMYFVCLRVGDGTPKISNMIIE